MFSALSTQFAALAFFLGQEKAPGGPPAPAPAPVPGPGQGPQQPGSPFGSILIPLVLIFVVLYFLIIMPERRTQKSRQAMIRNVRKGDQVVTVAGIIGKVTRVDEREVVLQVDKDSDVKMKFLKSAIQDVIPEGIGDGPATSKEEPK